MSSRTHSSEAAPGPQAAARRVGLRLGSPHSRQERQAQAGSGARRGVDQAAEPAPSRPVPGAGRGHPLGRAARDHHEARLGADLGGVRIHSGHRAAALADQFGARAFTVGRDIFFNAGQYSPHTDAGRQLLSHELAHTLQPEAAQPLVQRAMKFELQIPDFKGNRLWRNDGVNPPHELQRKFGPKDYLVKGASGVRLESETRGQIEFETGWHRDWPDLQAQLEEAEGMTKAMSAAPTRPKLGRAGDIREFPFPVPHLRTGSKAEMKEGKWKRRRGYESYDPRGKRGRERILQPTEELEVEVKDYEWDAGIQVSESFALEQYTNYLEQHEFPEYSGPAKTHAQAVLKAANTAGIPEADLDGLLNFLAMIVNYIQRGEGGEKSKRTGAFADVKGMPSKQAFVLLNRTRFSSIYRELLGPEEQKLFRVIVNRKLILKELGITDETRVFVKGYSNRKGPTVHEWLWSIRSQAVDLLSAWPGRGLSGAMGRHAVETEPGKKHTDLVRFEARNTRKGAWAKAKDWLTFASTHFHTAWARRPRPSGKGKTGLRPWGTGP